jgi:hypothetical protein
MSEEILNDEIQETEEVKTYDFPEGTVFYQEIREEDGYKWLAGVVTTPETADKFGFLDNNINMSELVQKNGRLYLKGYEKPEPTEDEKMKLYAQEIECQIDAHLQELASSRGYDDVKSCVGYFNSTDETFQREARAMTVYRDHIYRTCYNIMDQCEKGEIDYKTVTLEYILSLIDPIDW